MENPTFTQKNVGLRNWKSYFIRTFWSHREEHLAPSEQGTPLFFLVRSGHMSLWLWVSGPIGWGFWDGVRYQAALGSLGVDKA